MKRKQHRFNNHKNIKWKVKMTKYENISLHPILEKIALTSPQGVLVLLNNEIVSQILPAGIVFEQVAPSGGLQGFTLTAQEEIKEKITIVFHGTKSQNLEFNFQVKNNAQLEVLQIILTDNAVNLKTQVNVEVQSGATLGHVCAESFGANGNNRVAITSNVGKDANYNYTSVNVSEGNLEKNILTNLRGLGASTLLETATVASGTQVHKIKVSALHSSRDTHSNLNNVCFVNDCAKIEVEGLNQIEKGMSKSTAWQTSKVINLSTTAKSVANPLLIIDEFDVRAGHNATVGALDPDALYYLMSRGITPVESKNLIVLSHLENYLKHLPQDLKGCIKKKILEKIK